MGILTRRVQDGVGILTLIVQDGVGIFTCRVQDGLFILIHRWQDGVGKQNAGWYCLFFLAECGKVLLLFPTESFRFSHPNSGRWSWYSLTIRFLTKYSNIN